MIKTKELVCDYRVEGPADFLILASFVTFLLPTCILLWVLGETVLPAPEWRRG